MLISVLRFVGFKRAIGPMASRQLTLDYESLPGYTQIEVADAEIEKKKCKNIFDYLDVEAKKRNF